MKRRDLLRGLLALPFAGLAARAMRVPATGLSLLDVAKATDPAILPVVETLSQRNALLSDSDQTSIWLIDWGKDTGHRTVKTFSLPPSTWHRDLRYVSRPFTVKLPKRNWLKEKIRGY